jgi:peptidyl-prolyl cis-trans isomerase SurA
MLNDLISEAYERQKTEIRASHILVKCDPGSSPADTLVAYNKVIKLRDRVVLSGEDFTSVAKGKDGSEDPSVKDNGGDLGYFTAFQMVYPFEDAAYKTQVGEVSMPVRTKFGYHIIKVVDKRPARGEIRVSHIMVKDKKDPSSGQNAESMIREIYTRVQNGESFEDLASRYSEDASSAKKGGELPWFGTGKMVEQFENVAFSLQKDGDISEPFKTQYGWHIIKRLEKKPVPPFNEAQKELKNKVSKDLRSEKTKASFVEKLKTEYSYVFNEKNLKPLLVAADTNIFEGKLVVKSSVLKKPLFIIDGNKHPVQELYDYLSGRTGVRTKLSPQEYISAEAHDFGEDALVAYEDSKLESKYDAFRLLMNEYHEGILLFELTDQKVWSRAVKDSTGLEEFYNNNKDKFMWPERAEAVIYTCADANIAQQVRTMLSQGTDKTVIASTVNKNAPLNLQVEEGLFSREDKEVLSKINWKTGLSDEIPNNGQLVLVDIKSITPPTPKKLEEARGLVTSEYQNHLEQQWIAELRTKYTYSVNKEVLYTIH